MNHTEWLFFALLSHFFYNNCIRERSYFLTSFCICLPTFHAWKVCIISKMFFHNFLFGLRVLNISWMLNVRLVFATPLLRHMQWTIIIRNDTMYVQEETQMILICLLMVFFLAQTMCCQLCKHPCSFFNSSLFFSIFFQFLLPFLLTFLTFLVVQTVRCQLCQHPGGFVAVPRFMGLCSPGEKPGKTIMWNILFVWFVCIYCSLW